MRHSLLGRTLADDRRALIGWSAGIAVLVVFNMAFYPSIKGNIAYDDLIKEMPEALQSFVGEQSITTPAGYLEAQFFVFMMPLLFLIFAVSRGADAIAGEEQRKTIDLLLANPISRGRVILQKFGALVVALTVVSGVFLATLWASTIVFDMDIGFMALLDATNGSILLALFFGALALVVGGATGRKGAAIAVAAAFATLTYFVNSLAPSVEALEPVRKLSPFYYAVGTSPVGEGLSDLDELVVVMGVVVLVIAAVVAFDRRDVAV